MRKNDMTDQNNNPADLSQDDEQNLDDAGMVDPAAEEMAALQKQIDDLKDKLLRSVADYQNFARRSRQDVSEARDQTAFDLAKSLVSLIDQFDMALEVDPAKATTDSLLKGIRMVREEFIKTMEGFGVRRLDVKVGDEFDPKSHEALMQQESPGLAANHVAGLLQTGYSFKDRTLRPAKVSVTK